MKKHNIAFICPSTAWGGLEMNVFRLAGWLRQREHNIILYGNPSSILYRNCQAKDIAVRPLVSRSKFHDLFLSFNLAKMVRQDDARIVVLHMNKNFLLSVEAKRQSKKFFKLIYVQHMHVGPSKKDIFHNWLYSYLDTWVTPLPLFKKALGDKTNIPPDKIEIIPFGIELDRFTTNQPDKASARKKLNLPSDALIAGVVGRLDPKKGQHILIEACARLHGDGHKLHLLFVGDKSLHEETGYAERLESMVAEYNLREFVHFRPHMTEIENAYAAMDIFCLTSKSETYGMVTLEAMASGLPIIATREGGTVDIIKHESNGLLVTPYEPEELYNALDRIISDGELREKLSWQARHDATGTYSHQRQCEMLEDLFERLTAGNQVS